MLNICGLGGVRSGRCAKATPLTTPSCLAHGLQFVTSLLPVCADLMATAGRLNTCGPKEVLGVDWAQGGGGVTRVVGASLAPYFVMQMLMMLGTPKIKLISYLLCMPSHLCCNKPVS